VAKQALDDEPGNGSGQGGEDQRGPRRSCPRQRSEQGSIQQFRALEVRVPIATHSIKAATRLFNLAPARIHLSIFVVDGGMRDLSPY
jgi:hypothetical protein